MKAILTYHSVDDSGSGISISPARFAAHVEWLTAGVVKVMSIPDLLAASDDVSAVALTFDDAFDNFATHAWPLLRTHALPVTMFVPTSFVGRTNEWSAMPGGGMPTLRLLGWPALAQMTQEGLTLGAHTRTHPDLRQVAEPLLSTEIAGSCEDIARETGRRVDGFAYPYGYFDDRVVRAASSVCRWACTTVLAPLHRADDPLRLPRLDAYFLRGPGRLQAFGTLTFDAYMALRAGIRKLRGR